jgi:hypothetical protein
MAGGWEAAPGYAWRLLNPRGTGKPGFTRQDPSATGVLFTNRLPDSLMVTNRVFENGSGLAAGDIDGDGLCDLYFCSLSGGNQLYRNLGNWHFQEITSQAGVACPGQASTGCVLADVDGDGDLDLLVSSLGGGTRLFINDGRGRFAEPADSGLVHEGGSTSMALGDIDGDGDLDLYVAHYRTTNWKDHPPGVNPQARMVDGRVVVTPADRFLALPVRQGDNVVLLERGEPDLLYRNDGHGHFVKASWTDGTFLDAAGRPLAEEPREWGLSVMMRDFNGDGTLDLYVCNDFFFSRDQLWLNDGKGHFRAAPPLMLRNMSLSSMSLDVADINRDGFDDFFVADMLSRDPVSRQRQRSYMLKGQLKIPATDPLYRPEVSRNTLQLNRGDGTYAEIAQFAGIEATEWTWSCAFLDVDLDGYEDLLITNGNEHDVLDADTGRMISAAERSGSRGSMAPGLLAYPRLATPNLAYRNRHDLTFEDRSRDWGFDLEGVSHGMILADLDGDGDLDVVINNCNAAATLYRNDAPGSRVAVRLDGQRPNTQGIGARITVAGGPVVQSQTLISGGRYLSSDDPMRVFAAGVPSSLVDITVEWPSGARSLVRQVPGDRGYRIAEPPADAPRPAPTRTEPPLTPLFTDVSDRAAWRHPGSAYDDFARQPTLSFQPARLPPGVSWIDVDGDGLEDLVIPGPGSSAPVVFRSTGTGVLQSTNPFPAEARGARPQTAVVAWTRTAGQPLLLAGASHYEDGQTNGTMLRLYDPAKGTAADAMRPRSGAIGPVAVADVDGDGTLDLFLGGRAAPGRYPSPVPSFLYLNDAGRLRPDTNNLPLLARVGMVSAAVFTDLDGDGWPELVLACDWGPVRVFQNHRGRFEEVTQAWGFSPFRGCWNGVTAGDFDSDGRLDLVASNWGRNSRSQRYLSHPVRLYFGPSQGEPAPILDAFYDPGLRKYLPWTSWDDLAAVLPMVRERFDSYRSYGSSSVEEILGPMGEGWKRVEADTLDNMVFLNRGGRFEAVPLPPEAQQAPAFGVCVADFNGDGAEDLFLAQNFFGVPAEISRYDAGQGLVLLGDGRGGWKPLAGRASGIRMEGEGRGAAVADFDGDGRTDLAVAQHGGELKLFRNATGKPGLRVRLQGSPENPTGVGAVLQVSTGGKPGPAREIHGGGGFWSQDAATLVMALAGEPASLSIRWPGGTSVRAEVPLGAREITVDRMGKVRIIK